MIETDIECGGRRSHEDAERDECEQLTTCERKDAKGNVIKTLKSDEFSNIQNNPILQTVTFPATTTRFLKLSADRMVKEGEQTGIAELGVK